VIGVIDQPCKLNNSFKRKVYLYDSADFSSYREQLSQVNFDNLFASDDIDSITRSIVKKTGHHDIAEILLKVAFNTINQPDVQ
jgi:hypothetical protein